MCMQLLLEAVIPDAFSHFKSSFSSDSSALTRSKTSRIETECFLKITKIQGFMIPSPFLGHSSLPGRVYVLFMIHFSNNRKRI